MLIDMAWSVLCLCLFYWLLMNVLPPFWAWVRCRSGPPEPPLPCNSCILYRVIWDNFACSCTKKLRLSMLEWQWGRKWGVIVGQLAPMMTPIGVALLIGHSGGDGHGVLNLIIIPMQWHRPLAVSMGTLYLSIRQCSE